MYYYTDVTMSSISQIFKNLKNTMDNILYTIHSDKGTVGDGTKTKCYLQIDGVVGQVHPISW